MIHAEDLTLSAGGAMNEGPVATRLGLAGVPAAAEVAMVQRDILLAEMTGARLHVAHVSAAGSVRAIREAKARGVRVTAEATPHHFTLTDAAVAGAAPALPVPQPAGEPYDTHAKMSPPLREEADRQEAIVVDAGRDWKVDPQRFYSRSGNSPFAGWTLKGRVVKTFVGGRLVHEEGK